MCFAVAFFRFAPQHWTHTHDHLNSLLTVYIQHKTIDKQEIKIHCDGGAGEGGGVAGGGQRWSLLDASFKFSINVVLYILYSIQSLKRWVRGQNKKKSQIYFDIVSQDDQKEAWGLSFRLGNPLFLMKFCPGCCKMEAIILTGEWKQKLFAEKSFSLGTLTIFFIPNKSYSDIVCLFLPHYCNWSM